MQQQKWGTAAQEQYNTASFPATARCLPSTPPEAPRGNLFPIFSGGFPSHFNCIKLQSRRDNRHFFLQANTSPML